MRRYVFSHRHNVEHFDFIHRLTSSSRSSSQGAGWFRLRR
jgi:hypothetical protein